MPTYTHSHIYTLTHTLTGAHTYTRTYTLIHTRLFGKKRKEKSYLKL